MLSPAKVDAAADIAYGLLIVLAIVLIATFEFGIGIAFALGVFSAYVVHVVWKMARFDPDWMTRTVEETMEEQIGKVQAQVDAVEERVNRRPREEEVEEIVEEVVEDEVDL